MYLSKLTLDLRSAAVRHDLDDVNDMHRTIASGFPPLPAGENFRLAHGILWRLDTLHDALIQYIQSDTEPNWARLDSRYLLRPAEVRSLDPVLGSVEPGRKYAFRLVGNPTHCRHNDNDPKISRHVPLGPDQHVAWLIRKGTQHGFVIPTAQDGQADVARSDLPRLIGKRGKGKKVTITPTRFDGHLIVTDPSLFKAAITTGIGRAKPYGCGLLSLARPRTT